MPIVDLSRSHPNNPYRQPRYVPRSVWQPPTQPITGPAAYPFGRGQHGLHALIAHYMGSRYTGWMMSSADADVIRRLREAQAASIRTRGYSLYYNLDLPTDGTLWGIRDFDVRNAANSDADPADGNENDWSLSVHCIFNKVDSGPTTNVTVEPTWDQLESLRWLAWEMREYGIEQIRDDTFSIDVMPHCDIKPTGCCGDKAIAAIRRGELMLPPRTTTPTNPIEEDEMASIINITDDGKNVTDAFVGTLDGMFVTWQRDGAAAQALADGKVVAGSKLIRRVGLKGLTLIGPAPDDDGFKAYAGTKLPGRTRGSDFGARIR